MRMARSKSYLLDLPGAEQQELVRELAVETDLQENEESRSLTETLKSLDESTRLEWLESTRLSVDLDMSSLFGQPLWSSLKGKMLYELSRLEVVSGHPSRK